MTVCPKCKGYGIVGSAVPDILRGKGHIFSSNECDRCHGSGEVSEVEMTNEEWFENLTTKEKAKFISELMHHRSKYSFEIEKFLLDGAETHEQAVEMWLKEKHE